MPNKEFAVRRYAGIESFNSLGCASLGRQNSEITPGLKGFIAFGVGWHGSAQ
jgi:hypothetical protein